MGHRDGTAAAAAASCPRSRKMRRHVIQHLHPYPTHPSQEWLARSPPSAPPHSAEIAIGDTKSELWCRTTRLKGRSFEREREGSDDATPTTAGEGGRGRDSANIRDATAVLVVRAKPSE